VTITIATKLRPLKKGQPRGREKELIQVMEQLNGLSSGKQGPDPKDNALQASSTLNAFVGANVMSVYEVTTTLDTTKVRIVELEASIDTIKENVASEFRKEATTTEQSHREELERQLKLQERDLTTEFEKRSI
jgi:hypothetical protein